MCKQGRRKRGGEGWVAKAPPPSIISICISKTHKRTTQIYSLAPLFDLIPMALAKNAIRVYLSECWPVVHIVDESNVYSLTVLAGLIYITSY
jgi:hypothetical protein